MCYKNVANIFVNINNKIYSADSLSNANKYNSKKYTIYCENIVCFDFVALSLPNRAQRTSIVPLQTT